MVSNALSQDSGVSTAQTSHQQTPRAKGAKPLNRSQIDPLKLASTQFIDIVATAYKSLKQPDFAFVKKSKSQRPYESTMRRLRDYAAIEENIDTDDDVCFSFLLKGRAALWRLDLSMIGPFAIFVRLKNRVTESDFLHKGTPDLIDFETKIMEILATGGIKLMTPAELRIQVPLKLFNTPAEQVRLYQALFSDRPDLPWDGQAN